MRMKAKILTAAIAFTLSNSAFAEMEIDFIGGSEVGFEGLFQADYNYFDDDVASLNGQATDGLNEDMELRRAEVVFRGKGPGMWTWFVGYDGKADKFLDVNVGRRFDAYSQITVGQFKQPNSLEELGSTRHNDFISKALVTNLYAIARRTGVSYGTGGEKWTATGSVFGRELTRNLGNGSGYGVRATFAPILDVEQGDFFHLGVSALSYDAKDSTAEGRAQVRVRPGADLAGRRLIDSGLLTDADRIQTVGLEGAYVNGPFRVQSEYMNSSISRDAHPDYSSDAWYVYGLWNISGEKWNYQKGVFLTNLPDNPGAGMWQVGLRYDQADLNDTGVLGGKEKNWTVGANWYWRSNFKFMLNYVMVDSEKGAVPIFDDPNILEFRAQVQW